MNIKIDCSGKSHVGRRLKNNQDQFFVADLNKSMRVHQTSVGLNQQTRLFSGSQGKLMLVADGLGGHESGERASTLAVDEIANYLLNAMDWCFQINDDNEPLFKKSLIESVMHCQERLLAEADVIPQRAGMATTLTMAYIDWPKAYIVHVGDTRCYLIRGETIDQITVDHTIGKLREQIDVSDLLNEADIADHETLPIEYGEHTLWNLVGGTSGLAPEVYELELTVGDRLLLSSDGLHSLVDPSELLTLAQSEQPADQICQSLVRLANDRGGHDNITALIAKFENAEAPAKSLQPTAV